MIVNIVKPREGIRAAAGALFSTINPLDCHNYQFDKAIEGIGNFLNALGQGIGNLFNKVFGTNDSSTDHPIYTPRYL